jgi:hypothetical protein
MATLREAMTRRGWTILRCPWCSGEFPRWAFFLHMNRAHMSEALSICLGALNHISGSAVSPAEMRQTADEALHKVAIFQD